MNHQEESGAWTQVEGVVVEGHGVASGRTSDPRFAEGAIAMQQPFFEAAGLDLATYFPGTINVSITPWEHEVIMPRLTVREVKWCQQAPAEDFSFFDCRIYSRRDPGTGKLQAIGTAPDPESEGQGEQRDRFVPALVYRPHPETKPDHFQDPHVIELLAPRLEGVEPGVGLLVGLMRTQLRLHRT